MSQKTVAIFGGSGFLGRYLARELLEKGYAVNIISRTPHRASEIATAGAVGQTAFTVGNIRNEDSIRKSISGAHCVINLTGILFERGKQRFPAIHAQAAERIAKLAKETGVKNLVHVSSLGVDRATKSLYARTKITGEKAVMAAFPKATIIRPSTFFGPEDKFFNMFASLLRFSPFMPLIGGGITKFQPVYVVDVAKAIVETLENETSKGKIYEFGGPKIYSFKQLLEFIMEKTGHKRMFIPIPFSVAKVHAAFMELFPVPLVTRDQVTMLKTDNVVRETENTILALGIKPKSIEEIVPGYLERYKKN